MIERAHQAAVKDALAFVEKHALFTRTGRQGIRQVNVRPVGGQRRRQRIADDEAEEPARRGCAQPRFRGDASSSPPPLGRSGRARQRPVKTAHQFLRRCCRVHFPLRHSFRLAERMGVPRSSAALVSSICSLRIPGPRLEWRAFSDSLRPRSKIICVT